MRILIFLSLCMILGCNSHQTIPNEIITINVLKGLKVTDRLKLSDFAKDIEYIKLETKSDCLFGYGIPVIGKDHILIRTHNPWSILIFTKDGHFKTRINREGKGPGEFLTISDFMFIHNDKEVLIHDDQQKRFLTFDLAGNLKGEVIYDSYLKGSVASIIRNPDKGYAVLLKRPYSQVTNYPIILKLNDSFDIIDEQFPISVEALFAKGFITYPSDFFYRNKKLHFREFNYDTLYIAQNDGIKPTAFFSLPAKNPNRAFTSDQNQSDFNFIYKTIFLGSMIFIQCNLNQLSKHVTICYDTAKEEVYSLEKIPRTSLTPYPTPGFVNDLDGFPCFMFSDNNEETKVSLFDIPNCIDWLEKDFDPSVKVKLPYRQKQLVKLIRSSKVDDNPILQIIHIK